MYCWCCCLLLALLPLPWLMTGLLLFVPLLAHGRAAADYAASTALLTGLMLVLLYPLLMLLTGLLPLRQLLWTQLLL